MAERAIINDATEASAQTKAWGATLAGLLGAWAMTVCCILPLVLISVGITGSFIASMTAIYAYKWAMLAVGGAALGYAFLVVYRPQRCADGTCATPAIPRRVMKAILWLALAIMIVEVAFRYLYDPLAGF
jgi:mercuric ion transport protein